MRLTLRQLNRTTLQRQLLLERAELGVVESIRWLVGLQAQQPAAPYLALWNRLRQFDPADLDAAFTEHQVVKASLLRITLHAVSIDDHPSLHKAMTPTLRAARLSDRRFTRTGLRSGDADACLPELARFLATPRTNADVESFLVDRFPDLPETGVWWAVRTYAPLIRAPGPHPWMFGPRPAYQALTGVTGTPTIASAPSDSAAAMVDLARRYLAAYGPATAADLAQFSTLLRSPAVAAIAALGDRVVQHTGPDGKPVVDLAEADLAAEDVPAPPRLLGMWDNILLAHANRSRLIPSAYRSTVIRRNGDVLPTLLVDGQVAGVWRALPNGIEATAFHRLPRAAWQGLAEEASMLRTLLEQREPQVFSRYGHWWQHIDGAQVMVL